MKRKQYTRKHYYELPEEYQHIKHALIPWASSYILLEDGRVWTTIKGKFKKIFFVKGQKCICVLRDDKTKRNYGVDYLIRMFFTSLPEYEGVQHKPLKGFEDLYQIYSNGMIWSKRYNHYLSVCHTQQKYDLVCLQDENRKLKTGYIYRLVYQNFVGDIPEGYQLHHINGDHRNNSIQNLQLVTKEQHRKYHFSLIKGVKRKDLKYIKIDKIEQ